VIGAWLADGRVSVRDDLDVPRAGDGEALIRVNAAGVCGTDLELLRGYGSFEGVPGHEFVGSVEDGPAEWLGARVVSEINVTCLSYEATPANACTACAAGRPFHCERREVLGIRERAGAFAEWVCAPVRNLHRVPDGVSNEAAVFVEPLAAALRIEEQLELRGEERILVVGPGRLGQLVARALIPRIPKLEVAGRSEAARARASRAGIVTRPFEEVDRGAYDIVIECTGHPDGFALARTATRPGGTIVVKSTYANDLTVNISSIVVDEIRVLGSRCGPFSAALDALGSGRVAVLDLIDERYPLEETPAAFARAAGAGIGKVLIYPS